MDKFLNEELFEVVLERAFIEHEKDLLKSYPDDVELEREYPISKKEIRRFKNIVKEKEYGKKLVRVYLERAAVVVLCMISLFFALVMTSPEVRAAVENVILKWYDKYTEFIFTESTTGLVAEKIEDVEIGYVPDGFDLVFDNKTEYEISLYYQNINNLNEDINIKIFYNDDAVIFTDNEKMTYEKIDLNSNNESWILYNDEEKYGTVVIVGENISVSIVAFVEKNELLKIAENIL